MHEEPVPIDGNARSDQLTFRYFPPSSDEQRAFFVQCGGALLAFLLIGVLVWRHHDVGLRALLAGSGVGVLFMLARSAWQLEIKAARAQYGEVCVAKNGFSYIDHRSRTCLVTWTQIDKVAVSGGRLQVIWRDENQRNQTFSLGTREIEDGMKLIQCIVERGQSTAPAPLFIPLEPK